MWKRYRLFLEDNQELLKQRYCEMMMPHLAGAMMYFAKEKKSYAEKPELDFAERKNMGDVRMISIFRHNDFYDYIYVQEQIAKDTVSAVFLSCFQFDFQAFDFPSELPTTWDNYFNQWLEDKFNFLWLEKTLQELWALEESETLEEHLRNNLQPNSEISKSLLSILQHLYRHEADDGYTYLFIESLHQELLERISSLSLQDLHQNYEWYFWRFRADMRKLSPPTTCDTRIVT